MIRMTIVDGENLDQWTAEVTTPQETWKSPHPMPHRELNGILLSMGLDKDEILNAEVKAYVEHADSNYRRAEKQYLPLLQAALAGEREVPAQTPFVEAWMAVALSYHDGLRSLWEVIGSADDANRCYPSPDEISWAFLRLRRRGWLAIEGEKFGLTPEGYRAEKEIEDKDEPPWPEWSREQWTDYVLGRVPLINRTWSVKKLEDWMLNNPLPGDDKLWSADTKVGAKNAESEYRRLEKIYLPFLQAALAGEREVPPPQRPRIEVWFAYALYRRDGMHPLWEVIRAADEVLHEIPHYDDISWAFLRLRKWGWLIVDGERFGLTPEGRRVAQDIWSEYNGPYWYEKLDKLTPEGRHAVQDMLSKNDDLYWYAKIEKWLLKHPLPGDE